MAKPEELIAKRKETHGDWNTQSGVSRRLKRELELSNKHLTASQQEALDMIAVKMSRILAGNPDEPDHWDDIAGYAMLGKGGHDG